MERQDYLKMMGLPEQCIGHISMKSQGLELSTVLWSEMMKALAEAMRKKEKFRAVLEYDAELGRSSFSIIEAAEDDSLPAAETAHREL